MYRTDSQLASAPLIIDDTLYFICYDGGMLALPTTGGEARVLPFSYDDWMPVFYAGHYLYCRSVSAAPFCRTGGMRFNLENGGDRAVEYPGGDNVHSRCRRGRAAALPRCLGLSGALPGRRRDVPGAFAEHHAGIHPGRPRDSAVRQTCFTLPYDIPQPGSLTIYTYLGKCGSDFYFRADQCDDEYALVSQSVLRIGTDAPGPTLASPKRRITWITVRFCRAMRCAGS